MDERIKKYPDESELWRERKQRLLECNERNTGNKNIEKWDLEFAAYDIMLACL